MTLTTNHTALSPATSQQGESALFKNHRSKSIQPVQIKIKPEMITQKDALDHVNQKPSLLINESYGAHPTQLQLMQSRKQSETNAYPQSSENIISFANTIYE